MLVSADIIKFLSSRQANNLVPRALFLGFGGPGAPPPKPGKSALGTRLAS